jgi:hypothetical protein
MFGRLEGFFFFSGLLHCKDSRFHITKYIPKNFLSDFNIDLYNKYIDLIYIFGYLILSI